MSVYPSAPIERTAQNESITEAIVWAVAEAKDIDPLELDVPLYERIDPDALERILETESFEGRIGFSIADCEVVVYADRRVVVTGGTDATAQTAASAVSKE